jgi:hypothetical protein
MPPELQHLLEKFEYFPIKCKVLRARKNQAKYYRDLENQAGFWGNKKKSKTKASERGKGTEKRARQTGYYRGRPV